MEPSTYIILFIFCMLFVTLYFLSKVPESFRSKYHKDLFGIPGFALYVWFKYKNNLDKK